MRPFDLLRLRSAATAQGTAHELAQIGWLTKKPTVETRLARLYNLSKTVTTSAKPATV